MKRVFLNDPVLAIFIVPIFPMKLPRGRAVDHHSFLERGNLVDVPVGVERGEIAVVVVPETPYVEWVAAGRGLVETVIAAVVVPGYGYVGGVEAGGVEVLPGEGVLQLRVYFH